MKCPKCRSLRVSGPTYVRRVAPTHAHQVSIGEGLMYRCGSCGHMFAKPTADTPQLPGLWVRRDGSMEVL